MKRWHFIENGNRVGPFSNEEIESFLAEGRLNADSPIWCESMPGSSPIHRIPDFQPSPYAPPAAGEAGEVVWDEYNPSGPQVRPWIRFWARTFDMLLVAIIFSAAIEFGAPAVFEINDTLFDVLVSAAAIPVEAVVFSAFGTTPFKALLNVRVRNRDGSKLGFKRALLRSFSVWLRGQGIGIPIATLVANIVAYRRLKDQGVTSWDANHGFTVSHRTVDAWRVILLIAIAAGLTALGVVGAEDSF